MKYHERRDQFVAADAGSIYCPNSNGAADLPAASWYSHSQPGDVADEESAETWDWDGTVRFRFGRENWAILER